MSGDVDDFEVFEISEDRIMAVLWSHEELDGIDFAEDESGAAIVYADGLWTLNLFLLALAWTMGPDVEPDTDGHQRVYHTMAQLMMGISVPLAAPAQGPEAISCKLPAVRILWKETAETGGSQT